MRRAGMFLCDDEGQLKTTDVRPPRTNARLAAPPTASCRPAPTHPPSHRACSRAQVTATFINGKPRTVKGVVVIKGEAEWDRFMRFMER